MRIHSRYYPPAAHLKIPARYGAILQELLQILPPRSAGHVLEIGAESLQIAEFVRSSLSLNPDSYFVVDVSPVSVSALKQGNFNATELDVSNVRLPLEDGSCSAVIMSEVLEHLIDPDFALNECRRVLRPDGVLVLTTPNLAAWFNRLLLPLGVQPAFTETGTEWVFGRKGILPRARPVGHLRVLTTESAVELLGYHGFRLTTIRGLAAEGSTGMGWVASALDRLFSRFPRLAADALFVARKA